MTLNSNAMSVRRWARLPLLVAAGLVFGIFLPSPAWPVDECLMATGRAQEGCFNGADATARHQDEKVLLRKACEMNSMVALKACREGWLRPPAAGASACQQATAYAEALRELPTLASSEKVQKLIKEGGGLAFHGKDLLKKMKGMPESKRASLFSALHSNSLMWLSRVASVGGPCEIATP